MGNPRSVRKTATGKSKVTNIQDAPIPEASTKPLAELSEMERQIAFKAEVEALQARYGCRVAATIVQDNIVRNGQPGLETFANVIVVLDPEWTPPEA